LLALLLFTQAILPPSYASSYAPVRSGANAGVQLAPQSASNAFTPATNGTPTAETFGVVLTPLSTAYNNYAGIDYHQQSRNVVVSANTPSGQPHNFELIDDGGAHQAFSNISNLSGALKIATARDDGQGASLGGFRKGELFSGTGTPGVVARVAPDGAAVQNPWVTLAGEAGLPAGLHVDRTGVFGGDLIAVTTAGGVWRINASGVAAMVASLNTPLSGVTTIPDDAARYGPWAGKILAGAKDQGALYAIDAQGGAVSYPLGVNPEEIELIPAHENFFGLDPHEGRLWGAPADAFTSLIGDVLVAQESPGVLMRVRWNGTEFESGQIAQVAKWGQITFAPAGVAGIRGVKQIYDKLAVVRHAPVLNSGRIEGALWQLSAENVALGGTDTITSDLLVPGSPTVTVGNGHTNFAGVIEGVEDRQPSGYSVSIGANASLRHLITRTNPFELETEAAPPAPPGTRDVSITKEGEAVGEFSTLRDLSLSGKAGAVSVPPGTYGSFSLGGRTTLVLGVEHATTPAVYNLQSLTLAGGSELRLAGPVVITVKSGVSLTGSTVGAADAPRRMLLKVAGGEVKLGGNSVLYGVVRAPRSHVEVSGRSRLRGTVTCDRLTVSGNGVLQVTESDIAPPHVNRPPAVDAGTDQIVTLPIDNVSLNGTVSDDGLPSDGALSVEWSVSSGAGQVSFSSPTSAATTAVFSMPGVYVLKLTVSDGRLTRSDSVRIEVVPRNQPPTVDAGIDQTIKLSDSANLNGTVTDDALPHGSSLSVLWEKASGPGLVSFDTPAQTLTSASFNQPGTYVLRLTASDTEFSISDEVTIVVTQGSHGRVYTANADFDEGSYINVTRNVPDQLQLDETARTLNFIWVAVSSKGTVVKLDTETGAVLGEYLTSPNGQPRNPSRTTVDQNGNVWATNRDGNSVLHIGLVENGQCVDRNNNGVIDTSKGYGDIRPWTNAGEADTAGGVRTAQDECILHYTKVNTSGTRHVSVNKDNDVWVSGTGGQRFDLIDGKTGLIKRSESSVGYGGYGGLIDKNGVIWSARPLLRWDTSKPLTGPNGGNWQGYGHDSYGLCIDSKGNVWNTPFGNVIYKFAPDGTHLGTFTHGSFYAQGCVVDKNDDVWVAHSLYLGTVGHLKNNGVFVGNVAVGSGPTGVAVDSKGKIWATNHNTGNVSRIDPSLGPVGADNVTHIGAVDFTSQYLGGNLYNYSDMTGSTLSGAPDQGTWSTIFDSRDAGAAWGRINWTARVCGDGLLAVSVATSEDGATFNQPLIVSNGDDPEVPNGRFLKVNVRFERASSGESPVLYDLSVGTVGFPIETHANLAPDVDAGADQTIDGLLKTTLRGAACDDAQPSNRKLALSWSKLSGPGAVTFARPNSVTTEVTFGVPGTYELKLTADDSAHTRSDTIIVEVVPGNEPPVVNAGADQTVTHPDTAALSAAVTDDGLPRGGTLLVTWSKVSGPGSVTFTNPNAASTGARFGAPGAYVLKLTASDTEFARHDELTVNVGGENQTPAVNAGADQTITLPNTAKLDGTINDDGWPEGKPLAVSWSVVSGPGAVTFNNPNQAATIASFGEPGDYVLRLSASDSLLSGSDEVSINVNPAIAPPVVSIGGLPDGAEVTTRVNVTGTVSAGSNWRLEYASGDGSIPAPWTTLASGNTPVAGGTLGVFDPTLLLNGIYTLRLVATDAAAQTGTAAVSLLVTGEQKIGNFSLSFIDLNVPVAGLPIQVTRTYDSRDKRTGDFGVGWTLGVKNIRVEKMGIPGDGWEQTRSGGFLPTYCLQLTKPRFVTITFPDGKVYKFQTVASPQCSALTPIQSATMGFLPLPGTHGSLAALGENEVLVFGDAPGSAELRNFGNLELYNPTLFRFTSEDGTVYTIDQSLGVRSITDNNGNTVTVDANGIHHSSGKSITFTRNALGLITQITDPSGKAMAYAYDGNGDLVTFTDRENNNTSFTYNSTHGLLAIDDARGVRPIRNEYDDSGRLIKHTDAFGKEIVYTHNLDTRQEVITDRLGKVTVVEYDQRGNVVKTTDPQGNVTTLTYDARDNKLSQTNATGQTITYTYDAQDNRTSVTDALGNTTRFTFDSNRRPLTVTDPLGRVTTHTYDPAGNLLSTKDVLGNTTASTYNAKGQLETATNATGNVIRFTYDASGNVTKDINALGLATTYTYNANGDRLSQTETRTAPGGGTETLTTSFQYDGLGRLTRIIFPDSTTTEQVYNSIGRKTADVDQLGRRTTYEYDEMGQLIRTTYPDGTKEESTYDAGGRRIKETDRAGSITAYVYDAVGRVEKITFPDGSTARSTYDTLGRVTATFDERGNKTAFEYDPNCGCSERLTKVIDAQGRATIFTYDAHGNRSSMTDARGNTTRYEYDALDRRTRVVFADGSYASAIYDSLGRPTSQIDQAAKTTRFEYDALNRLVKVVDALNEATNYSYDDVGDLLSQTDANNQTTRFEYDRLGRRIKRTLPLGMSETYAYDAAGQLTSRTDFNGKTTSYAYDNMGRLLTKTPDPSLGQTPVVYTYNTQGLRASMSDATGATTYEYDALDRLKRKVAPQGALTYAYDEAGNLISTRSSNANGLSVNYAYDALNRLSTVTDNRLGASQTVYDYDEVGNLSGYVYGNGVRTTHTYNSLNRLTEITGGKASTLASYAYTLGPTGNRLSVAELGGRQVSYTYDDLYRLTSETVASDPAGKNGSASYTYDAVSNRKARASSLPGVASTTHEYDANNRLISDAYDANGNTLVSGGNTYRFDFENRLVEMNGGAVRVAYNGDGERVAKTVGGVTTEYLVDGNNPTGYSQVVEELQGGAVRRVYTYGLDLIGQNQLLGSAWSASFYGYDGHGSVRYLTDATGAVTDTYDYDAFGSLIHRTGTTPNDYLYAGEQFDEHLGLFYLRARYLNPGTGRFMTQDTYEGNDYDPASLHKYLYANANPVNMIDPSGHATISEEGAKLGIIGTLLANPFIWRITIAGVMGLISGVQGAIDASIVNGDALTSGLWSGAIGGVLGYVLAPYMALKAAQPILWGLGIRLTIISTLDAASKGNYKQAAFRAASGFMLPIIVGKIAQVFGSLKLLPPSGSNTLKLVAEADDAPIINEPAPVAEPPSSGPAPHTGTRPIANVPGKDFVPNPTITKRYSRPSWGKPTAAQRASVQGKPCVDCGDIRPNQRPDHIDPLSVEYYRTGTNNRAHQTSVQAVQPHCPACSASQGGQLSDFTRRMNGILNL
jgi:RHS repeat-associated protein